ncbi:MAG TPA: hypothetical protein VFX45_03690 [Solirubrobacterales bacterium]|nr:hypothetical protein [Solirubrobacterales bacterium]
MSKRLIALLAAVLAIAAIAGCGSSDSDTGTAASDTASASEGSSAPALSKAEFAKQGNEVCTDAKDAVEGRITEFFEGIDGEPSEEDQERVVTEVVGPSFQEIIDGIAALGAPEGEEDTVAEFIHELEAGVASIEDDPVAAVEDDDLFAEANEKATDLGLDVCAEN